MTVLDTRIACDIPDCPVGPLGAIGPVVAIAAEAVMAGTRITDENARQAAHGDGWTKLLGDGVVSDLCPEHSVESQ